MTPAQQAAKLVADHGRGDAIVHAQVKRLTESWRASYWKSVVECLRGSKSETMEVAQ